MAMKFNVVVDPLKDQLHGFTRSITEIQWLTLVLVLLYLFIAGTDISSRYAIITALVTYGTFVLAFNYSGFFREDSEWKLVIETWVMIAFITFVLWHAGGPESILANLYLLAIIAASLTLGKLMTMLEVVLIAACFVLLGHSTGYDVFTLAYAGRLMTQLGPMLLVAYLTTMLASDIHRAHEKIRLLASEDELTGLMNLRGFTNLIQREHELAVRYARQYTVAMIDIDNMKLINDEHGHEVGNKALKLLAAILRSNIRITDAAARFGGDEFVLLLVESTPETAAEVVARFRKQIEQATLQTNGDSLHLQVSIGLANYPLEGTEPDELLRVADLMMYAEKHGKREAASSGGDAGPPAPLAGAEA